MNKIPLAKASGILCEDEFILSRRSLVYHPQFAAVHHQNEVVYIIKAQADTRYRVMRYKVG